MPSFRLIAAAAVATLSLSACATRGALRRGLEEERTARIAADSAQMVEIVSLRRDLTALRTEFGAKISEVAEGIKFAFPVHFAYDDASVRSADVPALDRFASVVNKHYPGAKLTVEGFADPAGSVDYNLGLSQRRAESVRQYLTNRGVSPSLVEAIGYGKSRLVNRGASRDMPGAVLNRRVVFVVETPANAADPRLTAAAGATGQ
ncbi:MAG TPA: OmpA family protein [Gemmatimonadaceae bacterium]